MLAGFHDGPVTAKLCKSAKAAKTVEMGASSGPTLDRRRIWGTSWSPRSSPMPRPWRGPGASWIGEVLKVLRPRDGRHRDCHLPERWPERTPSRSLGLRGRSWPLAFMVRGGLRTLGRHRGGTNVQGEAERLSQRAEATLRRREPVAQLVQPGEVAGMGPQPHKFRLSLLPRHA